MADGDIDVKGMLENEIDNCNQYDMKANDNQSTNGEIGDEFPFDTIENLVAVYYTKEE